METKKLDGNWYLIKQTTKDNELHVQVSWRVVRRISLISAPSILSAYLVVVLSTSLLSAHGIIVNTTGATSANYQC